MLYTLKNGELFALREQLKDLLELTVNVGGVQLPVPARVQIRLVRLVKMLGVESDVVNETRNKYVRLYGEDKGNGNFSLTGPNSEGKELSPNWGKFMEEMNDLMNQTTKVEFEKVLLPDNVNISGSLLFPFEAFLEIEGEEEWARDGEANEPVPMKARKK